MSSLSNTGSSGKWRKLRQSIIKRDGCCQMCGTEERLSVDHIVPRHLGGDDNPTYKWYMKLVLEYRQQELRQKKLLPETWKMSNPGYGDICSAEDFESAVRRTPEPEFRTKRCGQWVSSAISWLPTGSRASGST